MTKNELRAEQKKRNLALSREERAEASAQIFRQIEDSDDFRKARCVALFCALPDEPATEEVLIRWARGKHVVIPRVEEDVIHFYEYSPLTLQIGSFGIAEPNDTALLCQPTDIDLMIIPGTAFTAAGARMGRGKGYYDKYLSHPGFRAKKVGVCYAHQLVGELPVEAHDIFMDRVITNN